jgi:hypothetical protein
MPVAGAIDSFLPITYPDDLMSNVHSTALGHQFQDFNYTIDSSLKSLTFAFASSASVEVIGIDSVSITGNPISEPVTLVIKPMSCPNPLNTKSKGVLPVAILGTEDFDVNDVDVTTVLLAGVSPMRHNFEDVATPFNGASHIDCSDCTEYGPDEFMDIILHFDTQEIVAAIGDVSDGDCVPLQLTGELLDETPFEGMDYIVVRSKGGKGPSGEPDECYGGVPKTGQTESYAPGDDGDLEIGTAWPALRFTDNEDGTVTDNLTHLIWLKDANCFGAKNWTDALSDCSTLSNGECGLTDGSLVGDWRLPNVRELHSLMDYGETNPPLPSGHPFTGVQPDHYWSSTTVAPYTSNAWFVAMTRGHITYTYSKGYLFYVWPVRGPE